MFRARSNPQPLYNFMRLLSILSLLLAGCAASTKTSLQTVRSVDLPRFMGTWHVIGTIPWFVEKDNVATKDIYTLRPDGRIDVRYEFRKKSPAAPVRSMQAVARVVDPESNARWAVQFLWPFEAPFLVIDLSPDYRYTTIGYPDRSLIWIMSRDPVMPEADYAAAVENARRLGYDPARIVRVPQLPES